MFSPLKARTSAVDECSAELRRAILTGRLEPGDRLPPERELAERFGVNRVTVRSALGRLVGAGLIKSRQGSGYQVHPFRRVGGPDLLPGLVELAQAPGRVLELADDLLRVRRSLARTVLEKLAGLEDGGADEIGAAIERFAAVVADGGKTEAVAAADVEVVAAILAATGSDVLALCLNPILTVVTRFAALRDAIYAEPHGNVLGWRLLHAWLEQKDPEQIPLVELELARRDAETLARLRRDGGEP